MKPDPFEHLTSKQLDAWMTLALATLKAERQRLTPFDLLLRDIYNATQQFMCEHGDRPKTVFLGFEQMKAFAHIPPWQIRQDAAMLGKPQMVEGLEVVQVLKDSFLQVA